MSEATVPAEQQAAGQAARIPAPDVDTRRAGDHSGPASQRSGQALSLIWRVRDRDTFAAFVRGHRGRRGPLTVTYLPDESAPPRVAYAIGRRVGPAVRRNRLRRRLRAQAMGLGLPSGAFLISVRPTAATLTYAELGEALRSATHGALRAAQVGGVGNGESRGRSS
jgi:ribonuclease P protein component